MNKAKKAYLQGIKDAHMQLKKEFEGQRKNNPGNLDSYTYGWLSQALFGLLDSKTNPKRKV